MDKQVDSFKQYFQSLVNQQVAQTSFNSSLNKRPKNIEPEINNNQSNSTSSDKSSLDGLFSLLNNNLENNSEDKITEIINKLISSGASSDSISDLLSSLVSNGDDLIYTRTNSDDIYLNLENSMKYIGGDLNSFIDQAKKISNTGEDISNYVSVVSKILKKGDYDDLRRFIEVTDDSINNNYDLKELFRFADKISTKYSDNIEPLLYGLQTLFAYNADLEQSLKILENMKEKGEAGRKNVAEINAFLVALKNAGYETSNVIDSMAESGNSILFLDKLAEKYGFRKIEPELNTNFKKIEGLDVKKTLVMKKGESVALHAEAMSTEDGKLSPELLFWSSVQTGEMADGTNYLDLSKLDAGEYDIYVKIGGGYPCTDTAKRKVRILGENESCEEEKEDDFEDEFKEEKTDLDKLNRLVAKTDLPRCVSNDDINSKLYAILMSSYECNESESASKVKSNDYKKEEKDDDKKDTKSVKSKEKDSKELEKEEVKKHDNEKELNQYYQKKDELKKDILDEDTNKYHKEQNDFWKSIQES